MVVILYVYASHLTKPHPSNKPHHQARRNVEKVEDAVFAPFCKALGLANIREVTSVFLGGIESYIYVCVCMYVYGWRVMDSCICMGVLRVFGGVAFLL